MKLQEIKELLKILDDTDISELKLESDGVKISIKKGNAGQGIGEQQVNREAVNMVEVPVEYVKKSTEVTNQRKEQATDHGLIPVVAPMVGTYYDAPAPDVAPFVQLGEKIKEGQTVCIIEAMKLMNEIETEIAGEIVDVLVNNGDPVEYGQTLFLINPIK